MSLKVIGAGLFRTGTASLKIALETLLHGSCYHMSEVFNFPHHINLWHRAGDNETINWDELFSDYIATVDTPACIFWPELMNAYPDALVILSVRDPASWLESCRKTVFQVSHSKNDPRSSSEWIAMMSAVQKRLAPLDGHPMDDTVMLRFYERHNARVRAEVPSNRLLVWQASDGWQPLCKALGVPIPNEAFPHVNSKKEWHRGKLSHRIRRYIGKHMYDIFGD